MADASPKGYPNTSLRWVVASLVIVLGFSVALAMSLQHRIHADEAQYAAAAPADATVVISQHYGRRYQDYIVLEWRSAAGKAQRQAFDVGNAAEHPVGSVVPVRLSATSSDQVSPPWALTAETTPLRYAIIALIAAMIIAALMIVRRGVQWWRAARGPARRHRAHVWYSYGKWGIFGIPWLTIVDGEATYHQRLMWEPWVQGMNQELTVEARRVSRGPFVVDVPGYGRLWPAGRARRRQPRMAHFTAREPSRFRSSRFSTVGLLSILMLLRAVPLYGWIGALVVGGYAWLLILYFGGAPAAVPGLMPKKYPRIKGLRSFSPTDALPQPVSEQRRTTGSRRPARRAGPASR